MDVLLVLSIYVLSVIFCRNLSKIFWRELNMVDMDFSEVVMCFIPFINILIGLICLFSILNDDAPLSFKLFKAKIIKFFFGRS